MRQPLTHHDTGDEHQDSLFDSPAICPHTGCLTSRRNLCRWEADRAASGTYEKRPKGCIAAPDPKNDPFPEGF